MPSFLLDANLSPKTARHLTNVLGLDVASLQGQRLGELTDPEVIQLARAQGRVIVTLDRDYRDYYLGTRQSPPGVIYLDLPTTHRFIPAINRILERFFRTQAASIDLERSLVVLTEQTVRIISR